MQPDRTIYFYLNLCIIKPGNNRRMTQSVAYKQNANQFINNGKKISIDRGTVNGSTLQKLINTLFPVYKNSYMYSSTLWIFLLLFILLPVGGQSVRVLDSYIMQGLENNLALKQKELNLENCLQALKEANGLFYPQVGVDAQYYSAKGGRSIDLPIGDLLNPVYSSLNQILEGMGQQGGFPQISNQNIQFLPNDYHDTKVRVIVPLVNAEIFYNRKIKKEAIQYSQAELLVYKRELIKDIKTAYLQYLQSLKVVEAYNSAMELVSEAYRVNEKLVNNQMAGKEKIFRIEAEKSQVEAQLTKAENDQKTSAAYFNFLLNQPLQTPIVVDSSMIEIKESQVTLVQPFELKNREELMQINSSLKQSEYFLKMKKSYIVPTISNITDLGYQGYYLSFRADQQYVMNTISFQWTLFNGFQNKSRIQQALIQSATIQNLLSETEQQIGLQEQLSRNNLESAMVARKANLESLNSSKEYFKVINRQYAEGQKSLLELLDARNQLTNTLVQYEISYFEVLVKQAEYERITASYPLEYE